MPCPSRLTPPSLSSRFLAISPHSPHQGVVFRIDSLNESPVPQEVEMLLSFPHTCTDPTLPQPPRLFPTEDEAPSPAFSPSYPPPRFKEVAPGITSPFLQDHTSHFLAGPLRYSTEFSYFFFLRPTPPPPDFVFLHSLLTVSGAIAFTRFSSRPPFLKVAVLPVPDQYRIVRNSRDFKNEVLWVQTNLRVIGD